MTCIDSYDSYQFVSRLIDTHHYSSFVQQFILRYLGPHTSVPQLLYIRVDTNLYFSLTLVSQYQGLYSTRSIQLRDALSLVSQSRTRPLGKPPKGVLSRLTSEKPSESLLTTLREACVSQIKDHMIAC